MKKTCVAIMAFLLMISLLGCGGGAGKAEKAGEIGSYVFYKATEGDQTYTADALKDLGVTEETMPVLELKEDGTGSLKIIDDPDVQSITWKDGKITSSDGESVPYTYKDGIISMTENDTVLEFKKKDAAK